MICSNSQCFVRKYTVFSPHDLVFLLIKRKKNYKAKFSTKLILKKIDKDNFGRKKTHEKYYSVFPNKINKDNFTKNHKKNHLKKYCSNPQCYVRKTTTLSPMI